MSPAGTLWKTNSGLSLKTILGQQQERTFLSCTKCFPILGQMWLLTTDGRRVIEYLHRHEELKIVIAYLCASSLVCTSPLAVTTVVGLSKGFQLI